MGCGASTGREALLTTATMNAELVHELQGAGYKVNFLDQAPTPAKQGIWERFLVKQGASPIQCVAHDRGSYTRAIGHASVAVLDWPMCAEGYGGVQSYDVEVRKAKTFLDAAESAGVSYIIYIGDAMSTYGPEYIDRSPFLQAKKTVESYLKTKSMAYTIIRPVFMMEAFSLYFWDQIQGGSLFWSPAPDQKVQLAAARDVAKMIVAVLRRNPTFRNKEINVASTEETVQGVINTYNELKEKDVKYFQMAYQTMAATSQDLTQLFRFVKETGYNVTLEDVQMMTNPAPLLDYRSWLEDVLEKEKAGVSPFFDDNGNDIRQAKG